MKKRDICSVGLVQASASLGGGALKRTPRASSRITRTDMPYRPRASGTSRARQRRAMVRPASCRHSIGTDGGIWCQLRQSPAVQAARNSITNQGRMRMRIEQIGDATLYLGDCREILPTLPKVDAVKLARRTNQLSRLPHMGRDCGANPMGAQFLRPGPMEKSPDDVEESQYRAAKQSFAMIAERADGVATIKSDGVTALRLHPCSGFPRTGFCLRQKIVDRGGGP